MSIPPKQIWLQWHGDGEPGDGDVSREDVTWCEDNICAHDVGPYVLASGLTGTYTWTPVEERLPEDIGWFPVWINNRKDVDTWGKCFFNGREFTDTMGLPPVTHWCLPLKHPSELASGEGGRP